MGPETETIQTEALRNFDDLCISNVNGSRGFQSENDGKRQLTEVRMNDGQHLNDSLIDFFVSMLVAHPVTGEEENMATERKSMEIISCHWALTRSIHEVTSGH